MTALNQELVQGLLLARATQRGGRRRPGVPTPGRIEGL